MIGPAAGVPRAPQELALPVVVGVAERDVGHAVLGVVDVPLLETGGAVHDVDRSPLPVPVHDLERAVPLHVEEPEGPDVQAGRDRAQDGAVDRVDHPNGLPGLGRDNLGPPVAVQVGDPDEPAEAGRVDPLDGVGPAVEDPSGAGQACDDDLGRGVVVGVPDRDIPAGVGGGGVLEVPRGEIENLEAEVTGDHRLQGPVGVGVGHREPEEVPDRRDDRALHGSRRAVVDAHLGGAGRADRGDHDLEGRVGVGLGHLEAGDAVGEGRTGPRDVVARPVGSRHQPPPRVTGGRGPAVGHDLDLAVGVDVGNVEAGRADVGSEGVPAPPQGDHGRVRRQPGSHSPSRRSRRAGQGRPPAARPLGGAVGPPFARRSAHDPPAVVPSEEGAAARRGLRGGADEAEGQREGG